EERHLATALFVDLVGFTPFTEQHDPEEVRAMLMRYFDVAKDVVARFGGEIDKFIGDAVLAFWGTSVSREDDAERAVRAALDLVDGVSRLGEELGIPDLRARAGVLTGETSVGSGGNTTGLVIGDIVNTASRLQSIADPGAVFVGESTRQLSAAAIHYEDAGEHALKGKSDSVQVFRAVRVTGERGGRGRQDGIEPPFVGRATELRMLQDHLHETTRDPRTRLVSIVGEAGHGKSRLAQELLNYVDGLAGTFLWHEGRSPAYGDGVSFWALGEMVRQRAGIAETDPPLVARTALRDTATRYAADDEEAEWLSGYLSGLLGIDEMPAGDRTELFAALRTFFQRLSEEAPVVLIFEDLHWADGGLLEFITDLVSRSNRHPILVVTLARPSLLDEHPDWGGVRGSVGTRLHPLGETDMRSLLDGTVDELDHGTADLIVTAAAGIPLYAVEFLRTLLTEGSITWVDGRLRQVAAVSDLSMPDSLHAIIGSRLDRFPSRLQSLIQDASVLGQSFTEDWLRRTAGAGDVADALTELVAAEVLRFEDDPRSPERGQYRFVQPSIREVAYGRLPKAERAERHLAIAQQFAGLEDPEFAAVVADHYLRALEAGAGEGALEEAHRSLSRAAQRAADLGTHAQVLNLTRRAVALPGRPDLSILMLGAGAAAAMRIPEEARSLARTARDQAESETERLLATRSIGRVHISNEDFSAAVGELEPEWDPTRLGELAMAWLGAEFARALMVTGDLVKAADVAELVLAAGEVAGEMDLVIDSINTLGTARAPHHYFQSRALTAEAVSLATRFGSLASLARALNNHIVQSWLDGRSISRDETKHFSEVAARLGSHDFLERSLFFQARSLTDLGRFRDALALVEELEDTSRDEPAFQARLLRWILEGKHAHLADIEHLAAEVSPHLSDDFQGAFLLAEFRCQMWYLAGDLARASEVGLDTELVGLPPDGVLEIPLLAALEGHDKDLLSLARARIPRGAGLRLQTFRAMGDAIAQLLEGDPLGEEAVIEAARFRTETDGPLAGHILVAALATTRDTPAVREARDATHQWFSDTGAVGFLNRFSAAWPETRADVV
ncbi:MAG: AAA family ATPase, partial [Acidimicrobiia bacterium]|nr:AAA family ATPase [Acidimicrobiia bacterium]